MNRTGQIDEDTHDLLARLDEPEHDPRQDYLAVRERIQTLQQQGAPVPSALMVAERQLTIELSAQSQGR
jgi:hypothetical protein